MLVSTVVNLVFIPGLYVLIRGRGGSGPGSAGRTKPPGFRLVTMTTSTSSDRPARVGLLGLPTDINSSHVRGAAKAPGFIREAIFCPSSNLWSETLVDLGAPGAFSDEGDVAPDRG